MSKGQKKASNFRGTNDQAIQPIVNGVRYNDANSFLKAFQKKIKVKKDG